MYNMEQNLIKIAYDAMENAYAPYSKYKVGAALLAKNGEIYTGCNIECASYGATNCAERTALFKAVSEGVREFTAIAIVSSSRDLTPPCGICRQVLYEFAPDLEIILVDKSKPDKIVSYVLKDLLPIQFSSDDIK